MEILEAIITQVFGNNDKCLECLVITSSGSTRDHENMNSPIALLLPKSDSLLTSSLDLSSNLYGYLIGQFMPMKTIVTTVDAILGPSRSITASAVYGRPTCYLVSYLLRVLQDRSERLKENDKNIAQLAVSLLAAWMNFDVSQVTDKVFAEFVHDMEDCLCWTLSRPLASLALLTYDCTAVVSRFFKIKVATIN